MNRREFIGGLGGAAWPLGARAQQAAVPVVGVLNQTTFNERIRAVIEAFSMGLAEMGFVEGRTVAIEYRWAEDYDKLPELAADLVSRQVAVIVAVGGIPAATAAKAATQTVPIVFSVGADPVKYGLVASLARPGGNATGFNAIAQELMVKRIELLHLLVPAATSIACLFNPTNPSSGTEEVRDAGHILGLRVLMIGAARQSDIEPAFAEMAQQHAGAVVVTADALLAANVDQVAMLAARHGLPAFFASRVAVVAGGLMSYGPSISDEYRRVGIYAGRILKGEKPADLPVQQPVKFEMAINLKTARALGIAIPPNLLALADEVIE